jgi:hypothetical protein
VDSETSWWFAYIIHDDEVGLWSNYPRVLRWSEKEVTSHNNDIKDKIMINATVSPRFLSLGDINPLLGTEGSSSNMTDVIVAAHPVVSVQCWTSFVYQDSGVGGGYGIWNKSNYFGSSLPDVDTVVSQVSDTVFDGVTTFFSPVWMPPTESEAHPLLVVFFSADPPREKSVSDTLVEKPGLLPALIEKADIDVSVTACSVSAYWNTGEIRISDNGLNAPIDPGRLSTNQRSEYRQIDLDFTDANTLQSAKFPRDLHHYPFSNSMIYAKPIALAAFLATELSNIPLSERINKIGKSESKPFISRVFEDEIPTADYTAFRIISNQLGFGYGTRSTSVYLSMTVLLLYCIIVVGYIVYTVTTGLASTAWSSGVELITLALQSKRPDHLGHTGVGIDSLKTLGESVGIRVNTDNEVELVFAHDRDFDTRGLRKLERNAAY